MAADFDAEAFDAGCGISPPPSVVPDYENPADVGWSANIAFTTTLVVVATVCCAMRFMTRLKISSPSKLEDVLCAVAWVFIMLYCGCLYAMGEAGEGRNIWEISCASYIKFLKLLWFCSLAYTPAALCVKVALLILEARIFEVFYTVAQGLRLFAIFTALAYTAIEIAKATACPVEQFWDPYQPCYNQRKVFVADRLMSILTDFVITVTPIPLVYRMNNLSRRQKIKVVIMLGAGGFATGATVLRLYRGFLFLESENVTADYVVFNITAQIELGIAITCLCLPSINLLLFRKRGAGSPDNSGNPPSGGNTNPDQQRHPTAPTLLPTTDLELAEFGMDPNRSSADGRREGWLSKDSSASQKERVALHSRERNMSWERAWDNGMPNTPGQGFVANATAPLPMRPHTTTTTITASRREVRYHKGDDMSRSSRESPRYGREWPWDGEKPQKHEETPVF